MKGRIFKAPWVCLIFSCYKKAFGPEHWVRGLQRDSGAGMFPKEGYTKP